ncbi:MAG: hypothetical protein H7Y15_15735 [Pseudonocardia sp.]|nr:hypothetical protein [Pseudonocardia sp.]
MAEGSVVCFPDIQVTVTDEVKQLLRTSWAAHVTSAAGHVISTLSLPQLRSLRDDWTEFLGQRTDDDRTPFAVRLAESPAAVAETLEEMLDSRRQRAAEFIDSVDRSVEAHEDRDLYEFAVRQNEKLTKVVTLLGLPVPDSVGPAVGLNGHAPGAERGHPAADR